MIDGFLRKAGKHIAKGTIRKGASLSRKIGGAPASLLARKIRQSKERKIKAQREENRKAKERLAKTVKRAKKDQKKSGLHVPRGRPGRG